MGKQHLKTTTKNRKPSVQSQNQIFHKTPESQSLYEEISLLSATLCLHLFVA